MTNGGPWGTGGGGDDREPPRKPGQRRPGEGAPIPEIEEFMKKGTEQLKVLMGGRGGGGRTGGPAGGPKGPAVTRGTVGLVALAIIRITSYNVCYTKLLRRI